MIIVKKWPLFFTISVIFCLFLTFLSYNLTGPGYLTFSDAAKFADIGRNILVGDGFKASFSFFSSNVYETSGDNLFSGRGIPVAMPLFMSLAFRLFGVTDLAAILPSILFFALSIAGIYLLAKSLFKNELTAILSSLSVGSNIDLINYALNGASESLFVTEIIWSFYLISLRKKYANITAVAVFFLMYLTRPQAFIYILGGLVFYLLLNQNLKKAFAYFAVFLLVFIFADRYLINLIPSNVYLISVISRGSNSLTQYLPGVSVSAALRGQTSSALFDDILKKSFYNLYNFYKLLPQILNPYLTAFFAISILIWKKERIHFAAKLSGVFMVVLTFVVAAVSIPFFRYLHPIIPVVYVFAIDAIVYIIEKAILKKSFVILAATVVVVIFTVGQTMGVIVLDSRSKGKNINKGRPPIYVIFSEYLKNNTDKDQVAVTNLDTWGSWYGRRSTVWYPITPKQLINPNNGEIPFGAIYLTDYLINDQNYMMGEDWHQIFDNPKNPEKWKCDGCREIAKEFRLKGIVNVSPSDSYENRGGSAILLIKKN